MSYGKRPDVEKRRRWQRIIGEAAHSGFSIREFCRRRRIKEAQFYWWQRRLNDQRSLGRHRRPPHVSEAETARFALVSDEAGTLVAGIELVLANGRRLHISQEIQESVVDHNGRPTNGRRGGPPRPTNDAETCPDTRVGAGGRGGVRGPDLGPDLKIGVKERRTTRRGTVNEIRGYKERPRLV